MSKSFEDLLGEMIGDVPKPKRPNPPAEKGVQIHGRQFDGTYYVRAEDIVSLLEANRVLPKIAARLKAACKR